MRLEGVDLLRVHTAVVGEPAQAPDHHDLPGPGGRQPDAGRSAVGVVDMGEELAGDELPGPCSRSSAPAPRRRPVPSTSSSTNPAPSPAPAHTSTSVRQAAFGSLTRGASCAGQGGTGMGGQLRPRAKVAVRGVLVGEGHVVAVGVGPDRVEQRNHLKGLGGGEAGEVLLDEGAAGQHRFTEQHSVAAHAADETDREPGGEFVPQVAEVLESLPVDPTVTRPPGRCGAFGQSCSHQAVEFAGWRGGWPARSRAVNSS